MTPTFHIRIPYDPALASAIKTVPGVSWNKENKTWHFPCTEIFKVSRILKKFCPELSKELLKSPNFAKSRAIADSLQEKIEASRASKSDLIIPCNEGQAYLAFQKAGIEFMANTPTVLLADEQGLGKTVQTVGLLNVRKYSNGLIICPASALFVWYRHLKTWLTDKNIPVTIISNDWDYLSELHEGFYIVSYNAVPKYYQMLTLYWDIVVLDEGHYIKNPKAKRTKACHIVSHAAKQKVVLTGTPILNKLDELFYILNFLDSKRWSNHSLFMRNNSKNVGTQYKPIIVARNPSALQEELRGTVMLRRLKSEVYTELPAKRRQIIEIPISPRHRSILAREAPYMSKFRTLLDEMETKNEEDFRSVFRNRGEKFKFMQHVSAIRQETALAKLPDCLEFTDGLVETTGKVVTWAHHKTIQQAIWEHYGDDCCPGEIGPGNKLAKSKRIDDFQTNPKKKVFDGSLASDGVIITLTAAENAVFFEQDWVAGVVIQAEDRIHRIGQKGSAMIYHVVLEKSMDYYLANSLVRKMDLADSVLDRK